MEGQVVHGPEYLDKFPTNSLGKIVYDSLVKHKGKTAFINEYTEESISYESIIDITSQLSQAFNNIGLKSRDDMIGICSENSIQYFCPMIASWFSGIPTVTISNHYLEAEASHALDLTRPSVIFCSKRTYQQCSKWKETFSFIKHVIVMDGDKQCDENTSTFIEKYCPNHPDSGNLQLGGVNAENSIALILFSSGTTGLPKAVMLTQNNCISRIMHNMDPRLKYYDNKSITLGLFPFFHTSGVMSYIGALLLGISTRVFWKFDLRLFLNAIEKHKVTSICVSPPILVMLAKNPIVDDYDLTSLEDILCGAAPISKELERQLLQRLKIKHVRQIYGLTETAMNFTVVPLNASKSGSVGKLVPGIMAAVRDAESGRMLGIDEIGEIIVKGDLVMAGYYKNPKANAEVFLPNGFLRTGDAGFHDKEEYFYIVDRIKELIKFYGYQVAPAEVEAILLKHPKIQDAGVIGIPDEKAGELPFAYVVRKADAIDLTEDEVKEHVAKNLSYHKHLRGGVKFVEGIRKNPSGKILRNDLRKMYKETLQ